MTWQDGPVRRVAVAGIGGEAEGREGELVRWYLEDYPESPADPAPALAVSAERMLASEGAELFRRVFSGPDAAGIWERARDRLGEVRVEVDTDPGDGPGLAWELLRDPARDAPVALGAGAFVRTHLRAAGHPDLPAPSGDRLRVLLVICRPGGRADVPFRSVASRLVRGGAERMEGLDLDVLRPATFARLSRVLHAAKAAGRPYHVVHFDGHGTYLDVAELGLEADGTGNGGGGIGLSPHMYGVSVAGPVRPGRHGYLLFEDPGSAENQQLVDGPVLGRLLAQTGVPVLVLNACREHQIGNVYRWAGDTGQALRHYQRAIQHHQARGDLFRSGLTRFNVAVLLHDDDRRIGEALRYVRAALDDFRRAGPGAASEAALAERFISDLEQRDR